MTSKVNKPSLDVTFTSKEDYDERKYQVKPQPRIRIGKVPKKRKTKRRATLVSQDNLDTFRVVEYKVTFDPIQSRRHKRLPDQVKDTFQRLHEEAQSHPHRAIPKLLESIEKYPQIPLLYNYLSMAYSNAGLREKMEEAVLENYRCNPNYLFARLNYAELFRGKGDYEQIAKIFEHKFDLKLLYPNRKQFHISEVASFNGLIGIYFFETGEREIAALYYATLKEIAPDYPMTKMLRRKLYPSFLRRLLTRTAAPVKQNADNPSGRRLL